MPIQFHSAPNCGLLKSQSGLFLTVVWGSVLTSFISRLMVPSPFTTGHPSSFHATGARNVSRPSTWCCPFCVRKPRHTSHQEPSCACTISAWPTPCIGLFSAFWLMWVRIGLAGLLSYGPPMFRLRAMVTLCPYSVPPSLIIR